MMPIQDVQFTDERWLQFWEHYKGLPHQKKSVIKLGQHIKYDSHVFANHGVALRGVAHDTLLQSYVLESHKPHDMDDLANRHLSIKTITYDDVTGKGAGRIGFEQVSIRRLSAGRPYPTSNQEMLIRSVNNLSARTDIGMADFGIAHLPRGQAHIGAMRDQLRMGPIGHDRVKGRRGGKARRIGGHVFGQAPAVEDAQDHGFRGRHAPAFGRAFGQGSSRSGRREEGGG